MNTCDDCDSEDATDYGRCILCDDCAADVDLSPRSDYDDRMAERLLRDLVGLNLGQPDGTAVMSAALRMTQPQLGRPVKPVKLLKYESWCGDQLLVVYLAQQGGGPWSAGPTASVAVRNLADNRTAGTIWEAPELVAARELADAALRLAQPTKVQP